MLYTQKFSAVRYVPWPPRIEKLDIIDKVGVQHLILDQIKACGEIWYSENFERNFNSLLPNMLLRSIPSSKCETVV